MTPVDTQSNRRILVIDDNAAIHADFRKILEGRGAHGASLQAAEDALFGEGVPAREQVDFAVDSAFQGQEGLVKVQEAGAEGRPYAVAFVDIRMPPGWDGIETIQHLWRAAPELQVVICTAYSDYSWDEIVKQTGMRDNLLILKKPFDNVEVVQLAHALTRKWCLAAEVKSRLDELDRLVNERTKELKQTNETLRLEIAERKAVAEDLRTSEERFVKAFRASPIPMAIQSLVDRRFVDANASFLLMTGRRWDDLGAPEASPSGVYAEPGTEQQLLSELREKKSIRNRQCRFHTQGGRVRQALVCIEAFDLRNTEHALIISQDITDRLALENQLRQAQKMEAVGQLAAGVAHDFNNLLTVIQGHASFLQTNAEVPADMADSVREISTAAERASSLTKQLLAFSRKQVMQPRLLDLTGLVRNLTKMLARLIGENIEMECEYASERLPVFADPTSLEQVLLNLAVNARDAMPGGGTLRIKTSAVAVEEETCTLNPDARPGPYARMSVTDTGCGMSVETLKRIFEPFFTTKEVRKGTGLGVASVHGIVRQHDGWVDVTSKPGCGSTFSIFIPLKNDSCAFLSVPPPMILPRIGRQERVLVVEDDKGLREYICGALEQHGYLVCAAEDGKGALRAWESQRGQFDLVLTDMVMPGGISGQDLASTLLSFNPRVSIICSTGYSPELIEEALLQRDNVCFLPKPYDFAKLVQVVQECVAKARKTDLPAQTRMEPAGAVGLNGEARGA